MRLTKLISRLSKTQCWQYRTDIESKNFCIFDGKKISIGPKLDHLVFTSTSFVDPGWYLFCIKHTGSNSRAFGEIRSVNSMFKMARPMYPGQKRYRIIHIKKRSIIEFVLSQLTTSCVLELLYIRKISNFSAWRRIKRRCSKLAPKETKTFSKKDLWRLYNHIQKKQRNSTSLFNYPTWRKSVEEAINYQLLSYPDVNNEKIEIVSSVNIKKVSTDGFVTPIDLYDQISTYIGNALGLALANNPDVKVLYGDDDIISSDGVRFDYSFRPAWNQELFWSSLDYARLWLIESSIWNQAFENLSHRSLSINLRSMLLEILFITEKEYGSSCIAHIPAVLLHKHKQTDISGEYPIYFKALYDFFANHRDCYPNFDSISPAKDRSGIQINWTCPSDSLLSIVIPTRDSLALLSNCIKSIHLFDPGTNIEILVIDNGTTDSATLEYLQNLDSNFGNCALRHTVIRSPGPFNYSALNNLAVKYARGNVILLLNNDTEFIHSGWGLQLASNALRPGIGCVGAKLLFDDETIQHAGVITGIGGVAGHSFKYLDKNAPGYQNRLQLAQEYSAVTGACLAISMENWKRLSGLDDKNLHVNYNDVDLCLRANELGLKNIYLPQVELFHYESKSRGKPTGNAFAQWRREAAYMKHRWNSRLCSDPSYHPYFTLESEDWDLWLAHPKLRIR